jgi:hypothetical protein
MLEPSKALEELYRKKSQNHSTSLEKTTEEWK